jgi:peptidase E
MAADEPTILATSGGLKPGERVQAEFNKLIEFAIDLAGVSGRAPQLCHMGTASGDPRTLNAMITEAGWLGGIEVAHLNLFPMPPVRDVAEFVLSQDVVWVNGGSVANLLALWELHAIGPIMAQAWQAGVVLGGVSAGSICWHAGGTTDSFGPELRVVTNGLALLPYGNGVHYDSEANRRPAVHAAVGSGELPETYCTDDGAGLLYRGTRLAEAVSERSSGGAYVVHREGSGVVEEELDVRRL